ncbi:PTS system, IIA component [Vibrio owensii]|uniref:PTS system, IIA component n=2 Tax=Vibrionaceae TaxID=641 RepID=A0AAU9Q540_9VIBR|nr:PTS system, IIA component [Vibrio owensii]
MIDKVTINKTTNRKDPMLRELITSDVIRIHSDATDWKDAVSKSCEALIENGAIEPSYVDAIYRSHEELGPYYVVGPGMAMPHARPEDGVNRLSLAITVIQNGVNFDSEGNDPVKMLVTLAATDSNSHVDAISKLAELFMNEEHVEAICSAQNTQDVLAIIEKY